MKRNKKLYLIIPLCVAVVILLLAMEGKAGIVRNATSSQNGQDSLSVPLYVLDTLGNRVEIDTSSDWGYIVTRYPNGTKAVSDSFKVSGYNTTKIVRDAAEYGGFAQFSYRKQISDLDGTPTNGTYSYEVTVRDSSLKLWTVVRVGEFQLYQTMTFASVNDSITTAITATNKANFMRWSAAQRDSLLNTILDANKVNFGRWSAAQRDSILNAIADANKVNFGRWSAAQRDSILNAITDVNKANFAAASSGITEAEMWEMLDTAYANAFRIAIGDTFATFTPPDSLYKYIWVYAQTNASITAAAIAADAIGSSELATSAVNEIVDQVWDEIIGGSHEISGSSGKQLLDGATVSLSMYSSGVKLLAGGTEADTSFTNLQARLADVRDSVNAILDTLQNHGADWGAGSGFSAADRDSIRDILGDTARAYDATGGSGSGWDGYPFYIAMTIDDEGATPTRQVVIDSAAVGGSNESGLVNKAITIRSGGTGKYFAAGVIEYVNCAAGVCTLQVADALPFSAAAGDSAWLWNAEPAYVIATVDEMAAANTDSILDRDLTGEPQDSTVKGFVKSGGAGGADTTAYKAMLANNGYAAQKDSVLVMAETGTADGALRRGEILTARQIADTNSLVLSEDSVVVRGGHVDSTGVLGEEIAGSGGSCTGDGAIAFNLYFVDSLGTDEAVGDGHIALYTNANCTGTPAYWGKTGALGYIPFSIDTGTYWACASKMASVTATSAQYFHVTSSSSDTVLGYGFATSTRVPVLGLVVVPGGDDTVCAYCNVTFEMVTAGGNIVDTANAGQIIIPSPVVGYTNSVGQVVSASGGPLELMRTQNLQSSQGATKYPVQWKYKVITSSGVLYESKAFTVSNTATVIDMRGL